MYSLSAPFVSFVVGESLYIKQRSCWMLKELRHDFFSFFFVGGGEGTSKILLNRPLQLVRFVAPFQTT